MPEKNPYPPGSARAKLWDRREAEKSTPPYPAAPPRKKRKKGFEAIEDRSKVLEDAIGRRRINQTTDSYNA